MKHGVIRFSSIAQCQTHRLDVQHWLPEHRSEQCNEKKRTKLKSIDEQVAAKLKEHIKHLYTERDATLEAIAARIRKEPSRA